MALTAFNLREWIEAHREELKPPVGNAQLWEDRDFIVMVVAGPNARDDFHINQGEEFFYQVEGEIRLRVVEDGQRREVVIGEGDIFLLPGGVPHSPQRPAGTVGLVIERRRAPGERDALRWYCDGCGAVLHEASFALTDITTQIRDAIEAFRASPALRTCDACGMVKPA